jgi:hypothetical protein
MSKTRVTKPASALAAQKPVETLAAADEISPTTLSSDDWAFLEKVNTFLFHIQAHAARARLHGYDDEENELGKSLMEKAAGRDRPLSHWMAEGTHAGQPGQFNAEQTRLLQEIDSFENFWFPSIRNILQRAIPEDDQELFLAAFFKDLTQQPFGPGVLDSVPTLMARFEELATNKAPGAKEAHRLGTKRGLTAKKIEQVRGLVASARKAMPDSAPSSSITPEQLAAAKKEQLAALQKLKRWYNDFATTFRGVFGTRVQIRLGLTSMRRSVKEETDGTSSDGEGAATPAAPQAGGKGGK